MRKKYVIPALRSIHLGPEGMIAASVNDGTKLNLHNESVDTQLTNQKDMWGDEGIWK